MTTVHLLSDLHIEHIPYDFEEIPPRTPGQPRILLLAGDIGYPGQERYERLLREAAAIFDYVFFIIGNHECYGKTLAETQQAAAHIAAITGTIFLSASSPFFDIPDTDLRVIGATLWTDLSGVSPEDRAYLHKQHRDAYAICNWDLDQHQAAHDVDRAHLVRELAAAAAAGRRVIVMTHHAPTKNNISRPEFRGCPLQAFYASALDTLLAAPVILWAHGHTHHSYRRQVSPDLQLWSNQRGYSFEHCGFQPADHITIR